MVAPAFGSIGTRLSATTTTPQVAAPAGVQTDDIIVVFMQANGSGTTITARPPGFAAVEGSPRTNAGGVSGVTHIEWKRATGADTGTYDFTLSASVGMIARAVRYTGAIKTGNPWDSPTASIDGSPGQPQNAPNVSIITLGPDRLLVYSAMGDNAVAATWTPPLGFATREGSKLHVSDRVQTDQGPTEQIHAVSSEQFHTLTSWLGALIGTPAPTIHMDDELLLEGAATTPAFGSIGAKWQATSTSHSIPVPSGVTGAPGEIVALYFTGTNDITFTITNYVAQGWTLAENGLARTTAGGDAADLYVLWRRPTGVESGTYSLTTSASVFVNAFAARYTGCVQSGSPWETPTASAVATVASQNAPDVALTTQGDNRLLCQATANWHGDEALWSPPSGMTERAGGSALNCTEVADKLQAVAGATGNLHASNTATASRQISWLGALMGNPAQSGAYQQEDLSGLIQMEPFGVYFYDDDLLLEAAAPGFGSIGTRIGLTTAAPSVPVPASVANNDIIVVYFTTISGVTVTGRPSGFAAAPNSPVIISGAQAMVLNIEWKRATGADSGTYDFTLSSSNFVWARAARYTGAVATGSPWDSPTSSADSGGVDTGTAPAVSITTAGPNRRLIYASANWDGDTGTWGDPATFTQREGGASVTSVYVADKTQAVAGASGAVQATHTQIDQPMGSWLGALAQDTPALLQEDGATLFQLEPKIEYATGDTIWLQDWTGQLILEDSSGGFQLEPLPPSGAVNGTAIGSAAQGAGQSASGAASGIASVTGSLAQGAGQSANGVGSAGAAAVGSLSGQGAGQSASGAATGTALVIGAVGQGTGQSRNGAGSAAATATGTTSGQGAGQAVSGAATGAAAGVGASGQAAGQAGAGAATGAALVVGTSGQGSAQGVAGTAVAGTSAVAAGATAQAAGQGRDGAATGAANAIGTTGQGAGRGWSGTAAAGALVVGTTGQASGQSRSGAGSGAAGAVGAIGQGSGQAASGATAAAATATGSSSQAAGQASSGAASGGATALGSPGQGAGLGITGSAVAGTSATGTGTSAQAGGQAGSGAATGAAAAVGSSGRAAGQAGAGAGSGAATATGTSGQAAGQAVNGSAVAGVSATGTGTSAQAAGQAASGAATGAATSVGSSGQAAGQGRAGASTGGATGTGTSGQGVGQGANGSAVGGVSATAVGSTAQGTGQAQAATASGGGTGTGSPARGAGQGRSGATTATAAVTGSSAQGTGQGWSGSGALPATALGSTARGVGLAISGTAVATFGRFIHPRVSGTTDRRENGRTSRGSGANYTYGFGVIPRPTGRTIRPNTGTITWP